jgi:hypothetical protein
MPSRGGLWLDDQRAHGLPQDLEGSDQWSADPPAATGAILPQQTDKNLLDPCTGIDDRSAADERYVLLHI